ncbi:MAG: DNA-directed RNA polymerase subunit beta' [Candidatus Absconditabacterales bacterium]|nr:DNA-directed RNA polymerase subunit beta' [Candidatus Absconditabacterales bacterium]
MTNYAFDGLIVKLASAETIEQWSYGSIDHADTINYRTGKPKQKGLFCEAIFGPQKNYECSCGKYKGVRYKGIICERCGVEVTSSRVRRERMGHIELAAPVVHVWYQNSVSGGIHHLLGISGHEIQKIISFVKYVLVMTPSDDVKDAVVSKIHKDLESALKKLDDVYLQEKTSYEQQKQKAQSFKDLEEKYIQNKKQLEQEYARLKSIVYDFKFGSTIFESDYRNVFCMYTDCLTFMSGSQAIYEMLKAIDVFAAVKHQLEKFRSIKSNEKKKKVFELIKLLINLYVSGVKPHNMVLTKLPVIPPDLRPVVQLEGGKYASSDVNLFYRRVLMRNLRLKKMIQVGMPDVVKKNEVRLLQEAVNNLFIGEKNSATKAGAGVKLFKSLSDMLSGKEGIFRKNLLGKRVDYSGRSVITVGPNLSLDECGVPLYIALRIMMPFIIGKLIEKKIAYTPKQAEKIIKDGDPVALRYLEEVIKDRYVLLNRAPTLHRLSIQAFKIKLMPGKTIRLHPLVCGAFNADFDGDQMAIHLPLSEEAQQEAKNLIAATQNVLNPASGNPTIAHTQDMILGIYHLTRYIEGSPRAGLFASFADVLHRYEAGDIGIHDSVRVYHQGEILETTVGRVIFNSHLPASLPFMNQTFSKKPIQELLNTIFDMFGKEEMVRIADDIKNLGFSYSTKSAVSINLFSIKKPEKLRSLLEEGDARANKIYTAFHRGLMSPLEKHTAIIQSWTDIKNRIEAEVKASMTVDDDLFVMIDSGAKGSYTNTTQISGMKGLVLNPQGEVIELPVKGNYIQGLSPIEYFISNHASRKGKADTALKTAESGYLTRKLCDACQEVIVKEHDCHTAKFLTISQEECKIAKQSFTQAVYGRVLATDVVHDDGTILYTQGTLITKDVLKGLMDHEIDSIDVRSALTCMTVSGVCQQCYGMDMSTRSLVDLGSPVGIIAAQSLGEPATQLTMRTFHGGGGMVGKEGDAMVEGVERIKQLFEVRKPKVSAIVSPFDGVATLIEEGKLRHLLLESEYEKKVYYLKEGYTICTKKGESLPKGGVYAIKGKSKLQVKDGGIVLEVHPDHIVLGYKTFIKKPLAGLILKQEVQQRSILKGEILTNGAVDIVEYQHIVGDLIAQKYIIDEVQDVYKSQGQNVHDKHLEVVVKQLFSKCFIIDAGNSNFIPGSFVKYEEFCHVNLALETEGKIPAQGIRIPLGLTNIAKSTDSWLSSASFQETIRVMVGASLKGQIDYLTDLKANVIIGTLLPLGENFKRKYLDKSS